MTHLTCHKTMVPFSAAEEAGAHCHVGAWFDRIDPGTDRRIKGLRLVTAFGLTAVLATASWKADQFADQMLWKKRVSGE